MLQSQPPSPANTDRVAPASLHPVVPQSPPMHLWGKMTQLFWDDLIIVLLNKCFDNLIMCFSGNDTYGYSLTALETFNLMVHISTCYLVGSHRFIIPPSRGVTTGVAAGAGAPESMGCWGPKTYMRHSTGPPSKYLRTTGPPSVQRCTPWIYLCSNMRCW